MAAPPSPPSPPHPPPPPYPPTVPPAGQEPAPAGQRSRTAMMLGAAALLTVAMSLMGGRDSSSDPSGAATVGEAPVTAAQVPPSAAQAPPAGEAAGPHLPRSRPERLLIPKISVDAPFTPLFIGSTGQLQPPPAGDVNLVGWHAEGVTPGEAGTAIIAGHVDTTTSPAVFARLGELEKGDVFHVRRADGRKATFVVDSAETFDKKDFPDERVYGDTPRALVRLITCAGDYDRSVRDYTDNLVVFAHLR